VRPISLFAPAKLNLFLAVTGRRGDGYHDLVSLVAPLDVGDTLELEPSEQFSLTCNDASLAVDDTNLVTRAATAFAAATGQPRAGAFRLQKRVPVGAGLGGGSSDAVAALKALNTWRGQPLRPERMQELAAGLGSDCPLFLHDGPVIIRGRGERVTPLDGASARRLRGRRVLIFKPDFPISTPWAYGQLAREDIPEAGSTTRPRPYLASADAEARLAAWLARPSAPLEELAMNSFERVVFAKYLALPVMLAALRERFGVAAWLSGSGSACFALIDEEAPVEAMTAQIRNGWGASAFVTTARLA
jgi:4-diphosphocytidyl-2-C-methyl-D-erythritol kinase